MGVEFIYKI